MLGLSLFEIGCGQYYRPVVIPCVGTNGSVPGCPTVTNPTPSNFHAVFAINGNGSFYAGTGMELDVSGDTDIGAANTGLNPTHAGITPNNGRVFVTNAGSLIAGGADTVAAFTPVADSAIASGLGIVTTFSLPAGSLPVFVNTMENAAAYVADFGTNSVAVLNSNSNIVSSIVSVGVNPVALAETPDATKLYVANQGDNTITSLNIVGLTQNTVTGFSGVTPVWLAARGDSQKIYVLTQGDGKLITIDTATDTVSGSFSVGAGANFIYFDSNGNRLYVTNPATGTLYIFSDTGGANDTPSLLTTLPITGLGATTTTACPGCGAAVPVSVTALPDGTRAYVASYQIASPCPDPNVTVSPCMVPELTAIDSLSNTLETGMPMLLLAPPLFLPATSGLAEPYAVPPVTACTTAATYSPASTRFRVFTTASADSTHVFVSMCDAGSVAVINTTDSDTNNPGAGVGADTVVTDLPAPFGSCSGTAGSCGAAPPLQNPLFMFAGN